MRACNDVCARHHSPVTGQTQAPDMACTCASPPTPPPLCMPDFPVKPLAFPERTAPAAPPQAGHLAACLWGSWAHSPALVEQKSSSSVLSLGLCGDAGPVTAGHPLLILTRNHPLSAAENGNVPVWGDTVVRMSAIQRGLVLVWALTGSMHSSYRAGSLPCHSYSQSLLHHCCLPVPPMVCHERVTPHMCHSPHASGKASSPGCVRQ